MIDPTRPIYTLTVAEFQQLLADSGVAKPEPKQDPEKPKRYVYGIAGLARLIGCSAPTAQRIKNSGILDEAISQCGRKIIADADKVLEAISLNQHKT